MTLNTDKWKHRNRSQLISLSVKLKTECFLGSRTKNYENEKLLIGELIFFRDFMNNV